MDYPFLPTAGRSRDKLRSDLLCIGQCCGSKPVPQCRGLNEVHVAVDDEAQIGDQLHIAWQIYREL